MELSEEVHNLLHRFKLLSKQSEESIKQDRITLSKDYETLFDQSELINVVEMDFSNEETWLYHSPEASARCNVVDLRKWLYEDLKIPKDIEFHSNHVSLVREMQNMSAKKNIDTRTFTRPKKKSMRPSIEKYNEDLFTAQNRSSFIKDNNSFIEHIQNFSCPLEGSTEDISMKSSNDFSLKAPNDALNETFTSPRRPLHFDLSQPMTGNIFDNILNNVPDVDSFQNMSPPSLVNSMSSSTFTNLMENSYIKNDPVLREIRDADYSDELLQDYQAPMFQSFTESCSSLNSDTPENFLLKTLGSNFNGTFKKNTSTKDLSEEMKISNNSPNPDFNLTFKKNSSKDFTEEIKTSNSSLVNMDATYRKDSISDLSSSDVDFNSSLGTKNTHHINDDTIDNIHSENIDPNATINISHTPIKYNGTYRKKTSPKINSTFQKIADNTIVIPTDLNSTVTLDSPDGNQLNECNVNRKLSYTVNDLNITTNGTSNCSSKNDLNQTISLKRNSFGYPAGSADSLDIISNLSNSSKGSNKMLNMAEVDAIIEKQEQSLQIMSTPKPARSLTKLWENELLSPIVGQKEHLSESDLSSTDEYTTVRSTLSKVSSINSDKDLAITEERTAKSLGNLHKAEYKSNPRSINTVTKGINSLKSNIRGSYSNLRTATDSNLRGSLTNLKSMGSSLKGSYTNLKPVCSNLPHANSIYGSTHQLKKSDPNITHTVETQNTNLNQTQTIESSRRTSEIFKVPPLPQETQSSLKVVAPNGQPSTVVKPHRPSGLPRPVGSTGIPRPVSKIPGPRTIPRPVSSTRSNVRISSKDGNY